MDAATAVVPGDTLLQAVAVEAGRARRSDRDPLSHLGAAEQTTPLLRGRVGVGVLVMLLSYPHRLGVHVVRGVLLLHHRAHLAHAAALFADHALETTAVAVWARLARGRVAVVAVDAAVAARGIHDGMTI